MRGRASEEACYRAQGLLYGADANFLRGWTRPSRPVRCRMQQDPSEPSMHGCGSGRGANGSVRSIVASPSCPLPLVSAPNERTCTVANGCMRAHGAAASVGSDGAREGGTEADDGGAGPGRILRADGTGPAAVLRRVLFPRTFLARRAGPCTCAADPPLFVLGPRRRTIARRRTDCFCASSTRARAELPNTHALADEHTLSSCASTSCPTHHICCVDPLRTAHLLRRTPDERGQRE
jgi:hypothetical protein